MTESIELDNLDSLVSQEAKTDKKPDLEVLKELFKKAEIESKTELSAQQVILINQKRTIAELLGWNLLKESLDDFMLLQVSKDRKGRAEFVDGFKSERESSKVENRGVFGNMRDKMGF